MEPKLPAYIIIGWSESAEYWNFTAVADSEEEAQEKRDHWQSKGERNLHILAVTEVLVQDEE